MAVSFLRRGKIFTEDRFSGNAHLQCRLSGVLFWILDGRIRCVLDQTVWLVVGGGGMRNLLCIAAFGGVFR